MKRRVLAAQNISRMCVVCGRDNAWSLKTSFLELEGGELLAVFAPLQEHQGYPGRLHGGIASALLDETIGRAIHLSSPDSWGVTVEFTVRYLKPVPLDREVRALARITRDSTRLFEGSGEIVLDDGTSMPGWASRSIRAPGLPIGRAGRSTSARSIMPSAM